MDAAGWTAEEKAAFEYEYDAAGIKSTGGACCLMRRCCLAGVRLAGVPLVSHVNATTRPCVLLGELGKIIQIVSVGCRPC